MNNITSFGKTLRIAFYGDVNNNYFSFMRHLRDLGVDAHLFLYKDQDTLQPRWAPQSDTYEWDKWKDYVHHTQCRPHWLNLVFNNNKILKKDFDDFDILFISGFAAALFARAGIQPDYYLPYSIGFEIINRVPRKGLKGLIDRFVVYWQTLDVKSAKKTILSFGNSQSKARAQELGLAYEFYTSVPMVYPDSAINGFFGDSVLNGIIDNINASDFVVSCHVRHDWKHIDEPFPELKGVVYSKRTDILIRGFAKYLKHCSSKNPKLLFAEYGPHIAESKALIAELGITNRVYWYPELKRKQIMQFLPKVDVTGGEFADACLTGGVVLESLASGKPLLNAMSISNEEYLAQSGMPLPPIIPCSTVENVCDALIDLETDKEKRQRIGQQSKEWFDNYGGIGLAKRYLKDFEETVKKKKQL